MPSQPRVAASRAGAEGRERFRFQTELRGRIHVKSNRGDDGEVSCRALNSTSALGQLLTSARCVVEVS